MRGVGAFHFGCVIATSLALDAAQSPAEATTDLRPSVITYYSPITTLPPVLDSTPSPHLDLRAAPAAAAGKILPYIAFIRDKHL